MVKNKSGFYAIRFPANMVVGAAEQWYHMNKAQWNFLFGPVVWVALAFGHVHNLIIYYNIIRGTFDTYGSLPHATVLGSLLPWAAFALKFLQVVGQTSAGSPRPSLHLAPTSC